MVALESLALCLSLAGAGQVVLLDFYSDNCPPCRQMAPHIDRLIAEGYPVRKINVDREPMLAQQYGVDRWPTFLVLGPTGEVGRVVGGRPDTSEIAALFERVGFRPDAAAVAQASTPAAPSWGWATGEGQGARSPARGTLADTRVARGDELSATSATQSVIDRALAASVRLKIEDGSERFSYGSGTIIDMQDEEALVLTCGHVFHDSQGKGRVTVDLFDASGAHSSVAGQVIHFDEKRDVGLVAIRPGRRIEPMPVGGQHFRSSIGMQVFSIGCDRGAIPSVRESRVTNVNRYLGPANIQVAGAPVDGRSGGGLFSADGTLIGVCNAADPQDDEGLYAALETVHAELTAANLSFIYNGGAGREPPSQLADSSRRELRPHGSSPSLPESPLADDDTEVILIVRSRSQPARKAETLVVSRPPAELLRSIAALREADVAPQNTSLQVATPRSAVAPAAPRW